MNYKLVLGLFFLFAGMASYKLWSESLGIFWIVSGSLFIHDCNKENL
jgi:uncharacterized membrane protein HdeD (DUF308 family)